MPGEFSNDGSNRALDAVTGRVTVSGATTYLALYTSAPTDTSAGTEYTATGYSRKQVTWTTPANNGSGVPETSNSVAITFGPLTSGTGSTITSCALMSAETGGTRLAFWTLASNITPSANDLVIIGVNGLKLSVD